MPDIESFMPPLNHEARLGLLFFMLFVILVVLCMFLPRLRKTAAYKTFISHAKPGLVAFGWLLIIMGSVWSIRDFIVVKKITNLMFLGASLIMMGNHIIKIGYEDAIENKQDATSLKIVSVSLGFAIAFMFLELFGSTLVEVFK